MKLVKQANSEKLSVKMSRSDWERIGKQAGWLKEASTEQKLVKEAIAGAGMQNVMTGATPALGKEGNSIRFDIDDLAGIVDVRASPLQKVGKLVALHLAPPVTGRADPQPTLRFTFRPLV